MWKEQCHASRGRTSIPKSEFYSRINNNYCTGVTVCNIYIKISHRHRKDNISTGRWHESSVLKVNAVDPEKCTMSFSSLSYSIWPWSTSQKKSLFLSLIKVSVLFFSSLCSYRHQYKSDYKTFWFLCWLAYLLIFFWLNSIVLSWSCWVQWCLRHQMSLVSHHLIMIHWKFKTSRHIRCLFLGCFGVRSLHICQPKRHVEDLLCWHVHLVLVWTVVFF